MGLLFRWQGPLIVLGKSRETPIGIRILWGPVVDGIARAAPVQNPVVVPE